VVELRDVLVVVTVVVTVEAGTVVELVVVDDKMVVIVVVRVVEVVDPPATIASHTPLMLVPGRDVVHVKDCPGELMVATV